MPANAVAFNSDTPSKQPEGKLSHYLLDRVYPCMPVWLQNLGISIYGLAYRSERLGGRFAEYADGFRQRDRWSPDRMNDYVTRQLRATLVQAFENTLHYRRKWTEAGIALPDLERISVDRLHSLPITSKSDLRSDPDGFIAHNVAQRDDLHYYYTSGSTGTPISCAFTANAHRRFFAAREVRSFGWAGTSIQHPRAMIGGRMVLPRADSFPPFFRYNWAERQVYFSAYHISPDRVPNYVAGFNRYRPKVFTGYAYAHYALARMMLEQGLRLDYQPEALVLSSEKLTTEMKTVIGQAFGARAYEEYGAVEQCVLLTECESGNLHVNSDFGIVEVVDAEGNPTPPGTEGRLICTGLLNDAQPLVRYDIGDTGVLAAESCPCGRDHLPVVKEITGRLEDAVVCRDGRVLVRFHGIFINLPHVIEGQVIQEAIDHIRIRVVATEGFGPKEEELIRHRIADERLGPMRVDIERTHEIERTERGKFRAVICKLTPEERARAGAGW